MDLRTNCWYVRFVTIYSNKLNNLTLHDHDLLLIKFTPYQLRQLIKQLCGIPGVLASYIHIDV